MTIADSLMILSVLLAPLVALQVQKHLKVWEEKKERRVQIFKMLMSTRATRIDPSHVAALNMIDLEFKDDSVTEKWREYMDSHVSSPKSPDADASIEDQKKYDQELKNWSTTHDDKFINLLYEISKSLKYKFDKVHLKKSIYYPKGLSDIEIEQQMFRRAAISFLSGNHPVKMAVIDFPSLDESEEVKDLQAKLRQYIIELIEGKKSISVSISDPKEKLR
ncbi:MAG: hypothetical protein COB49_08855 [Alphaproteobacteria bacterium]|nr:MAG: hypothetical protein COB49_08855 [Alphaproteobacteria bacterium]